MADIIELHPAVRERLEPRVSAAALAEYLIMKPQQQETVLHDCRFSRPPIVAAYGDAMRAFRAYNTDPRRDPGALEHVKAALMVKASGMGTKPKAKEEALRCVEAIELFERAENAFGLRRLPLVEAPRFVELDIEGVSLSVQPDFLVEPVPSAGRRTVGGIFIRSQKAPDPEACRLEETRRRRGEHRREMARYMASMIVMLLEARSEAQVDRELCFVADIRLGERIGVDADHSSRLRAIQAACRQISRLWDSIEPRTSVLRKPA